MVVSKQLHIFAKHKNTVKMEKQKQGNRLIANTQFYKSPNNKEFVAHYGFQKFLKITFKGDDELEPQLPEILDYPVLNIQYFTKITRLEFGEAYAEATSQQMQFVLKI